MKWLTTFLCAMSLSVSGLALAANSAEDIAATIKRKTLTFAAPMWDGYTHKDGSGLYWEILEEVYAPLGFKLRLKNQPWNRSMKLMTEYRAVDGVPGEGLDSDYENLTFSKYPLEPEYLAIAYQEGTVKSFDQWPDLTGKVVGMRKGYNLIPEGDRYGDFEVKEFINLKKGMALLEIGDIDVLVDELAEIEAVAEKEEIELEQFEVAEFVTGDYYYMSYGDGHVSKPLADIFDVRIEVLAKQGRLQALYDEWNVDIPEPLMELASQ